MSIVLAPPLLAELLLLLVPLLQPAAAKAMTINAAIAVVRPIVFLSINWVARLPRSTLRVMWRRFRISSAAAPGQGAGAAKPQVGQGGDRLSVPADRAKVARRGGGLKRCRVTALAAAVNSGSPSRISLAGAARQEIRAARAAEVSPRPESWPGCAAA